MQEALAAGLKVERVEVLPHQNKWILHLAAADAAPGHRLEDGPAKQVWEERFRCFLERQMEGVILEFFWNMPLEALCRMFWPFIVDSLVAQNPLLYGCLTKDGYSVEDENTLTLLVAHSGAQTILLARQGMIVDYFQREYGKTIAVRCKLVSAEGAQGPQREEEEEQRLEEKVKAALAEQAKNAAAGKGKNAKQESSILWGKNVLEAARPLSDLAEEERSVVVSGRVFALEQKLFKTGTRLVTFGMTDNRFSIPAKVYVKEDQEMPSLQNGMWIKVRGAFRIDSFTTELTLTPNDIVTIAPPERQDAAPEKRVELHLHTKMSEMDGVSTVQSLIQRAARWGHEAIAITDHGVVQAFPDAVAAAEKNGGLKIIFGMEGYLVEEAVPPAALTADAGEKAAKSKDEGLSDSHTKRNSFHIVLLARDPIGIKNLYKLVTYSHLEHFRRRPRIPRALLESHRAGLLVGSACEGGELIQAILKGQGTQRLLDIASFYDYLEIQPIANNAFLVANGQVADEEALRNINRTVLALGRELGRPVVATGDVHFLESEDEVFRRILMAGSGYSDADHQAPLYLRTTEEMLEEFAYLGEQEAYRVVVTDPRFLAAQVEEMKPFPNKFFAPQIEGAAEKIETMAWAKAAELYGYPLPPQVEKVLTKELKAIIGNGFSALYWVAHLLVKKSNEDGYLVGSRGSVGSSLVATMTGITEVNPLPPHYRCANPACLYSEFIEDGSVGSGVDLPDKRCSHCGNPLEKDGYDIPFETFLGFEGEKIPDIDLNFSGEYQLRAHKYTEEIFGKEHVFRAGTISTLANKTAYGYVKNYLEERGLRANSIETQRLVQGCEGVKKTTGQHPGGLIVLPKECDVFDFTPLQRPANDVKNETITTHFDYHSISGCLVKMDILGHDDPTVIRMLEDLTGIDARTIPLGDRKTMSLFSGIEALGDLREELDVGTGTLGIPEFGTKFVRQMLEDLHPSSFSHLVQVSGLSHGTEVWLNNAQDLIKSTTADISQIICCRDDIMTYLIRKDLDPSLAFKIMESVRKGKGLWPEAEEAMRHHEVPVWYIESCQKIKYMFPKAHAVAYVTMAFRIAWFKVNYPEAFYASYFTVRATDFDADLITAGSASCRRRAKELAVLGKNASGKETSLLSILEVAIEMYCRGFRFRKVDLWESTADRFLITPSGLLPPFSSLQGVGETAAKNLIELRERHGIYSVEDLQSRGKLSKTVVDVLRQHGCLKGLPESNQISLF